MQYLEALEMSQVLFPIFYIKVIKKIWLYVRLYVIMFVVY